MKSRPIKEKRLDGLESDFEPLLISCLRAEFGQPNAQVDRFLHYCSIRGSNVPGEPKLAKALLDEILKEKANLPDKADKATSC